MHRIKWKKLGKTLAYECVVVPLLLPVAIAALPFVWLALEFIDRFVDTSER